MKNNPDLIKAVESIAQTQHMIADDLANAWEGLRRDQHTNAQAISALQNLPQAIEDVTNMLVEILRNQATQKTQLEQLQSDVIQGFRIDRKDIRELKGNNSDTTGRHHAIQRLPPR